MLCTKKNDNCTIKSGIQKCEPCQFNKKYGLRFPSLWETFSMLHDLIRYDDGFCEHGKQNLQQQPQVQSY